MSKIARVSSQIKHYLRPVATRNGLHERNYGLYAALDIPADGALRPAGPPHLLQVLHAVAAKGNIRHTKSEVRTRGGANYLSGTFTSFDSVEIPYYEILPPGFITGKQYPTVILYSERSEMDQVAFGHHSYQKGLGAVLAQCWRSTAFSSLQWRTVA